MAEIDQVLTIVIELLDTGTQIVDILSSQNDWPTRCINDALEWRDMLQNIGNSLNIVDNVEIIDTAVGAIKLLCFYLDLAILPPWTRELYVASLNQPQNRVGRPPLFQPYVPLIKTMVEQLDYTNQEVRDMLKQFGVNIDARQLGRLMTRENIIRNVIHVNDDELSEIIRYLRFETNTVTYGEGYRAIQSYLVTEFGLRISLHRIGRICRAVDPDGVEWRRRRMIRRRRYNCLCPYEMFHCDANLKLVNWKFYIHGCIDGYSRYIVYVKLAGRNDSRTLEPIFEEECLRTVGRLPYHVRTGMFNCNCI